MILTPRRRAILAAMRIDTGMSPTWREIGAVTGIKSLTMVDYHLVELRNHGYVTWEPSQCRTLRLTGKGLLAAQGYEEIYRVSKDGTLERPSRQDAG